MRIDIKKILEEIQRLPDYDNQISLQTVEGCTDHNYGTGRLDTLKHSEKDFTEPLWDIEYTNNILTELKMCRTRIMKMKPKSCYTYHQDPSKRIHIPLITNESNFMVIDGKVFWYPADGNYYVADTTKLHTFVNASREFRIHIVGCI